MASTLRRVARWRWRGLVRGLVKDRERLEALTGALTGKPAVVADVADFMALYGAGMVAPNKAEAFAAPA